MGSLKISDQTLGEVAALARAERVGVEDQAEALIREALEQRRQDRQAVLAELRAVRAMTPRDMVQTDSVVLLREDRDR